MSRSWQNNRDKVRTQLWDTLYLILAVHFHFVQLYPLEFPSNGVMVNIYRKRQWPAWRRSQFWSAPTRTQSSATTPTSPSSSPARRRSARRTLRRPAPSPSPSRRRTRQCRSATLPWWRSAVARVPGARMPTASPAAWTSTGTAGGSGGGTRRTPRARSSAGCTTSPPAPPDMWRSGLASLWGTQPAKSYQWSFVEKVNSDSNFGYNGEQFIRLNVTDKWSGKFMKYLTAK